ncbi:hypothetical protein [Streptomyces sp. NPDC021212]|uniref:hypothetical protein n=1 Tax=Streptomyces sp. NPDC021212 TaxID=3365118 RepID=UPI0037A5FB29
MTQRDDGATAGIAPAVLAAAYRAPGGGPAVTPEALTVHTPDLDDGATLADRPR